MIITSLYFRENGRPAFVWSKIAQQPIWEIIRVKISICMDSGHRERRKTIAHSLILVIKQLNIHNPWLIKNCWIGWAPIIREFLRAPLLFENMSSRNTEHVKTKKKNFFSNNFRVTHIFAIIYSFLIFL